jgi:transcription elongation factor GreA
MTIQKPVYLTQEGLSKLEARLKHLTEVLRPEVAERIRRAKEIGGTLNNAEYDDAKNEQAFLEGEILDLGTKIKNAQLIQDEKPSTRIRLGSHVTVIDADGKRENYVIVGSAEASPGEGRISNESPMGKALMGRKAGDRVEVATPSGVMRINVFTIK